MTVIVAVCVGCYLQDTIFQFSFVALYQFKIKTFFSPSLSECVLAWQKQPINCSRRKCTRSGCVTSVYLPKTYH